jgi:hypothetical protein
MVLTSFHWKIEPTLYEGAENPLPGARDLISNTTRSLVPRPRVDQFDQTLVLVAHLCSEVVEVKPEKEKPLHRSKKIVKRIDQPIVLRERSQVKVELEIALEKIGI